MQAPSLTAFLGDLESEDLARRADALREMTESDGWRFFQEMLEVQRVKLVAGGLNVFRGRNTAHRVTPVEGNVARRIAVFSFSVSP